MVTDCSLISFLIIYFMNIKLQEFFLLKTMMQKFLYISFVSFIVAFICPTFFLREPAQAILRLS